MPSVAVSITCLDPDLKRRMEPRAPSARARLDTIEALAGAGIPVTLLFAPVIPALNDADMEAVLTRARDAGAGGAAYILLRLPLEIGDLFGEWLQTHYPLRAEHVMSLLRQCRGGQVYDNRFGHRMRGTGPFAALLDQRFRLCCKKLGLTIQASGSDSARSANTDLFDRNQLSPLARPAVATKPAQHDLFRAPGED